MLLFSLVTDYSRGTCLQFSWVLLSLMRLMEGRRAESDAQIPFLES